MRLFGTLPTSDVADKIRSHRCDIRLSQKHSRQPIELPGSGCWGSRQYNTDLNSWSVGCLSQQYISSQNEDFLVRMYSDWADGRSLPMSGSFAFFKMNQEGKKKPLRSVTLIIYSHLLTKFSPQIYQTSHHLNVFLCFSLPCFSFLCQFCSFFWIANPQEAKLDLGSSNFFSSSGLLTFIILKFSLRLSLLLFKIFFYFFRVRVEKLFVINVACLGSISLNFFFTSSPDSLQHLLQRVLSIWLLLSFYSKYFKQCGIFFLQLLHYFSLFNMLLLLFRACTNCFSGAYESDLQAQLS